VDDTLLTWVAHLAVPHRADAALRALLREGPGAFAIMRDGLRHASPEVRLRCCQYFDRFLVPEILGDLLAMLDDPDPRVRVATLHTLACDRCKRGACRADEDRVLHRAIGLLQIDPDPHARAMAIEVIGRWVHLRDEAAAALVAASCDDSSASVRKKAAWYAPGGPIHRRTSPRPKRRPLPAPV